MKLAATILPPRLPECFVSCFEQGERWRRQWKIAVQALWAKAGDGKPDLMTVTFSTN